MKKKSDPFVILISMVGWFIIVVSLCILGFIVGFGDKAFEVIPSILLLTVMLPLNVFALFILGFARLLELLNEINNKL